jgi:diketogulonate reductase-like aldo/keto reductase
MTTHAHAARLLLPAIGFGTYTLTGLAGAEAVTSAIDAGYTLIDSAFNYENEGAVGAGVRAAAVPRDDIVVTSKLPGRHHAYDEALATVEESVFRTGLDRIDLYLIHWPNPIQDRYIEAWRALIEARERGLVREIGVCNFLPEHIDRLERETGVLPAVNQIELHPYFPQTDVLDYDSAHGIVTEAWSPLGRGNDLLSNPVVAGVAAQAGVTPGQAVLAWHVLRGAVPIPKARSAEHQRANLQAADTVLTSAQLAAITALGRPDGRLAGQDPATYEEF